MERYQTQRTQAAPANGVSENQTSQAATPVSTIKSGVKGIMGLGSPSWQSKVLVVCLIVIAITISLTMLGSVITTLTASSGVKDEQYQAVFLDNGQVYFGKITNQKNGYIELTDIYYLQVQQQIQPDQDSSNDSQTQPKISLAKLGNELHGPEDVMFIASDKITFWENLKKDGKVTQAITEYVKNGGKTTDSTTTTPSTTTNSSNSTTTTTPSSSTTNSSETTNP